MTRTERLLLNAQGVADGSGNVTFVFPVVPESLVWTGRASIVGTVPTAGKWLVEAGYQAGQTTDGTPLGLFNGNGPYDNLQIWGTERLLYIGTGLTPGASYTAIFAGQSNFEGEQPMTGTRLIQQDVRVVALGAVTFRFPAVPQGERWSGRVFIPDCTAGSWRATLNGGQTIGGWSASQPFGPVDLLGGEQLVVTGTGVTPSPSNLVCMLIGHANADDAPAEDTIMLITGPSGPAGPAGPPGTANPALMAHAQLVGSQPTADGTPTVVPYDTVVYDDIGCFLGTPDITFPDAGPYIVSLVWLFWNDTGGPVGPRSVRVWDTGFTNLLAKVAYEASANGTSQVITIPYKANAGDTMFFEAQQDSGGPMDITDAGITVVQLSPP